MNAAAFIAGNDSISAAAAQDRTAAVACKRQLDRVILMSAPLGNVRRVKVSKPTVGGNHLPSPFGAAMDKNATLSSSALRYRPTNA